MLFNVTSVNELRKSYHNQTFESNWIMICQLTNDKPKEWMLNGYHNPVIKGTCTCSITHFQNIVGISKKK